MTMGRAEEAEGRVIRRAKEVKGRAAEAEGRVIRREGWGVTEAM